VDMLGSIMNLITAHKYLFSLEAKLDVVRRYRHPRNGMWRGQNKVYIERARALNAKSVLDTIFDQICSQMKDIRDNDKLYDVCFINEEGIDAGGPYREALSMICEELHKPPLLLFVPSPNKVHNAGEVRDKNVINPALNSFEDLQRFEFLGRLIGSALNGRDILDLNLPAVFWKSLVNCARSGSPWGASDLEETDKLCCQNLDAIVNIAKEGVTPDTFHDVINFSFTTQRSDDQEIEVTLNGSHIPVTFENRAEYATLVLKARTEESLPQLTAILRGVQSLVPPSVLGMFTWQELESAVCGASDVNLELLRETCIVYYAENHKELLEYFWKCLEEFTPAERSAFLKFTFGRSKLSRKEMHIQQFKINVLYYEGDGRLPCAHTCSFTLDLPVYTSYEILKQKLTFAIQNSSTLETR